MHSVVALFRVLEGTLRYDETRSYKLAPTNEKRNGAPDPVHASFWTATPSGSLELHLGPNAPGHGTLLGAGNYVRLTFRRKAPDVPPPEPGVIRAAFTLGHVRSWSGGYSVDLHAYSGAATAALFGEGARLGNAKLEMSVSNLVTAPFFVRSPDDPPAAYEYLVDFEPG